MEEPEQYAVANLADRTAVQEQQEINPASRAPVTPGESSSKPKTSRSITVVSAPSPMCRCDTRARDHRVHRAVRMRQDDRAADPEPHERPRGGRPGRGRGALPRGALYANDVSPIAVRRRIGMVFQKPNPFPKSIYDNVAYGPRINGERNKGRLNEIVERSLRQAALWDEVKDRLNKSALGLSGGQQQRLCIARTLAVEPDVVLMDEPCSALDPIATGAIEDLMQEIKSLYTIVIVTHNMQQATRVSDRTAFFSVLTTRRAIPGPVCSSSTTGPPRSSRTRPTAGPGPTSPAGWAEPEPGPAALPGSRGSPPPGRTRGGRPGCSPSPAAAWRTRRCRAILRRACPRHGTRPRVLPSAPPWPQSR